VASLSRQHFSHILARYCEAWRQQDADKILLIFTEDATYHERLLEKPIVGHAGIRDYWVSKVVQGQANINVRVVNEFVDGNVGIAEWEVHFDDRVKRIRKFMREIAIMEFRGDRIKSLREYWVSKELGAIA